MFLVSHCYRSVEPIYTKKEPFKDFYFGFRFWTKFLAVLRFSAIFRFLIGSPLLTWQSPRCGSLFQAFLLVSGEHLLCFCASPQPTECMEEASTSLWSSIPSLQLYKVYLVLIMFTQGISFLRPRPLWICFRKNSG